MRDLGVEPPARLLAAHGEHRARALVALVDAVLLPQVGAAEWASGLKALCASFAPAVRNGLRDHYLLEAARQLEGRAKVARIVRELEAVGQGDRPSAATPLRAACSMAAILHGVGGGRGWRAISETLVSDVLQAEMNRSCARHFPEKSQIPRKGTTTLGSTKSSGVHP